MKFLKEKAKEWGIDPKQDFGKCSGYVGFMQNKMRSNVETMAEI